VGARAYDPRTARWLQRDPIDAASGDPNLYRYCGNDPINQADPTGLDWLDNAAKFSAGWGDRLTGDLTKYLRDRLCDLLNLPRFEVDPCDEWYLAGHLVGAVHDRLLTRGIGRGARATNKIIGNGGNENAKGGVYSIREKQTGEVVYVGRSSDLASREQQHRKNYPKNSYEFKVEYRTDDYNQQRGLEQYLYDKYQPRNNRIRPISPRNPKRSQYEDAARKVLGP
jgi:uncharacterized protein RhaS with RHS repeats